MTPKQAPGNAPEAGWHRHYPVVPAPTPRKVRAMVTAQRSLVVDLKGKAGESVLIRGWVFRLRVLAKTTFIVLKDCSGEAQCVASTDSLQPLKLKLDDALEIYGMVRVDERAKAGIEVDIESANILNRAATMLPFSSSSDIEH